jgi:cobalt-zinc-cadmium efflux system outer membrane protein
MEKDSNHKGSNPLQQVSMVQADSQPFQPDRDRDKALEELRKRLERLKIPEAVPGSETPPITWPKEAKAQEAMVPKLYPPLPKLPVDPKPQPGPNGRPYTLADLQRIAAANSPQLRQAVSDVEAARGMLIQARAYPNPTLGWNVQPSNDGSTAGAQGPFIDQRISVGGKLKLAAAAAQKDLDNAELALRRARSDLATSVRNAYYAVLVAQETVRVTKALASFTDEVYQAQADVLKGGFAAPYEPATLRSQAWTVRLALNQAIAAYIYSWKELVAAIGLRQLPLTEVAGRIDRFIPYYDYDAVLAHVLRNHTDVLTARNTVDKAGYNLKLAQITPYPDVDFNVSVLKEYSLLPKQFVHTVTLGFPLPIWDRNRGNIMAAEAAQVRASEEPHRVEMALTNALGIAYTNYKNNLDALEYYRKYILPDQVRTYRGIFERRRIDPSLGFVDLVTAQQSLATNVTTYLGILGTLWTSVVSVADLLQTDDLFQLSQPRELPALPDLETLPGWFCPHPSAPSAVGDPACISGSGMPASASSPVAAGESRRPGALPPP